MPRYLIEGSCDGALFAEAIDANSQEDAEAFAIERLCEAWGEEYGPDTTLDDLGDSATVREYSRSDYARDAADEMLSLIEQIARMKNQAEADGQDLGNDLTMDGLIARSRAIVAKMEG